MGKLSRLGYIGGTFDMLHWGHVRMFGKVKDRCDGIVVSLSTDEFVTRYRVEPPILTLNERILMVGAVGCLDMVAVNYGAEDSTQAILASGADSVWHDDSWTGQSLMDQMGITHSFLVDNGILMRYVCRTEGISTTEIIERVEQRVCA